MAISKITSVSIATNTIANTNIAAANVDSVAINPGAITASKIAAGNVVTAAINAGAVTDAKIATGTISSNKLATGVINANTLVGSGAITAINIANDAIGPQHLQAGAVNANTVLATNAITADLIATGAVGPTELAAGAVSANTKMAADVVGARELRIGNVAAANGVFTHNTHTFRNAQRARIEAVTVGAANVALDFANAQMFSITLGTNSNLNRPSNLTVGQSGTIFVVQDGTGSRTLSYSSVFDFVGGEAPTLTTTASAVDRIDYVVRTTSSIHAVASLALS